MYRILNLSHYLKCFTGNDQLLKNITGNHFIFNCYRNIFKSMILYSSNPEVLDALPESFNKLEKIQTFQNLLDTVNFANVSNQKAEQLLTKCGSNISNASKKLKDELCQNIYKNLLKHDKVNLSILHAYISVCTENNAKLNIKEILENIHYKINGETYKLLLKHFCEQSDINEALRILDLMKLESVPLDEFVFNNLILVHSSSGGLPAAELVLNTMKAAQLSISNDTRFSILKGLSRYSSQRDFQKAIKMYAFELNYYQLIEIVNELGLYNKNWFSEMEYLYNESTLSKEFQYLLKQKCISLIHMNKSDAALYIFKHFFKMLHEEDDGFFILEEMLCCNYDSDTIKTSIKNLQNLGPSEYLLEKLIGLSLKTEKTDVSWALLEMLSSELRPHYFWSLLISASKREGEVGIFQAVSKMKKMKVQFDFDTWAFYIFPYCILDDCKLLIKRFKNQGFSVKELLSPLLYVLIRSERLKLALVLCNYYNVNIFGENFLKLISKVWVSTKDSICIVSLLQKYCESNNNTRDFVGEFLMFTFKLCKTPKEFEEFYTLLKVINEKSLKILNNSADTLKTLMESKLSQDLFDKMEDQLNTILDFRMTSDVSYIPRPKDMSVEELECHLVELTEKSLNTRGILRKLILLHSSLGNIGRVSELRQHFLEGEYEESIGMKSSIFYGFIKAGKIEAALQMYKEMKETKLNFILDDFKVIDLCTLLVKNDREFEAWTIIEQEAKIRKKFSTESIKRNCLELLNAFKNEDQQMNMFTFLINNGYCKPENVLLGPLVRIHLTKGNLKEACDTYINLCEKYKCTPLQVELLKEILMTKNEELLRRVLKCTANIHGKPSTQTALIAAAAESGKISLLARILSQNANLINQNLKQRCDRWVTEGKAEPLMTLLSAYFRVDKNFSDSDYIIKGLLKIYGHNNNMDGITRLYNYLIDNGIETPGVQEILKVIENMQQTYKYQSS